MALFSRPTVSRFDELRRIVERDPSSRQFLALAEEYRRAGKAREVIETLEKGLRSNPGYVAAHVALGRAYQQVEKLNDAIRCFQAALKHDAQNLVAIRQLGDTYLKKGDKVEAIKKLKLFRGLSPGDRDVEVLIQQLDAELNPPKPQAAGAPQPRPIGAPRSSVMRRSTSSYSVTTPRPAHEITGAIETRPPAAPLHLPPPPVFSAPVAPPPPQAAPARPSAPVSASGFFTGFSYGQVPEPSPLPTTRPGGAGATVRPPGSPQPFAPPAMTQPTAPFGSSFAAPPPPTKTIPPFGRADTPSSPGRAPREPATSPVVHRPIPRPEPPPKPSPILEMTFDGSRATKESPPPPVAAASARDRSSWSDVAPATPQPATSPVSTSPVAPVPEPIMSFEEPPELPGLPEPLAVAAVPDLEPEPLMSMPVPPLAEMPPPAPFEAPVRAAAVNATPSDAAVPDPLAPFSGAFEAITSIEGRVDSASFAFPLAEEERLAPPPEPGGFQPPGGDAAGGVPDSRSGKDAVWSLDVNANATPSVASAPEWEAFDAAESPEAGAEGGSLGLAAPFEAIEEEPATRPPSVAEPPPLVSETLADLYRQQGHVEAAREVYETLARTAPSGEKADEYLSRAETLGLEGVAAGDGMAGLEAETAEAREFTEIARAALVTGEKGVPAPEVAEEPEVSGTIEIMGAPGVSLHPEGAPPEILAEPPSLGLLDSALSAPFEAADEELPPVAVTAVSEPVPVAPALDAARGEREAREVAPEPTLAAESEELQEAVVASAAVARPAERLRLWASRFPPREEVALGDIGAVLQQLVSRAPGIQSAMVTDREGLPLAVAGEGGASLEGLATELTSFWRSVQRAREDVGGGPLRHLTVSAGHGAALVSSITSEYSLVLQLSKGPSTGRARYEASRIAAQLRPAFS